MENTMTCGFAMSGTYGHECGAPATKVAVKASKLTKDGLFYTGRCNECARIKGGENAGNLRLEPVAGQVNQWNGGY
jgi:hypothetical protein